MGTLVDRAIGSLWAQPARVVVLSFLTVALAGAGALMLPVSHAPGTSLTPLDALFTAVSAVCVTGLIVVDTAARFSVVGHIIILVLIQLGGLGIMVFTVATMYLVRRQITMDEAEVLSFMLNESNRSELVSRIRTILMYTAGFEFVGAAVLTIGFLGTSGGLGSAAWLGLFHAVSAFCNAGFALFSDSLIGFSGNPLVTGPVGILIVAGGLGFGVLSLLGKRGAPADRVRRSEDELSYRPQVTLIRRPGTWLRLRRSLRTHGGLSVRVALWGTVALIVAGTLVFYLVESRRLLFGMTLPEKYGAALFQSITLRTAGFSTVSIGALHPGTLVALLPFMFIGAAAGGTAGGIKIGTAATISAEFRRFFTRRRDADLFNRRLPDGLVIQAFVLVVVGVAVVFVATVVLVFTEAHPLERLVFEVVSALGTVGLSADVTPELSNVGRVTIIFLMLVGRLGPLTLLAAFRRIGRAPNVRLPRGELPIG